MGLALLIQILLAGRVELSRVLPFCVGVFGGPVVLVGRWCWGVGREGSAPFRGLEVLGDGARFGGVGGEVDLFGVGRVGCHVVGSREVVC